MKKRLSLSKYSNNASMMSVAIVAVLPSCVPVQTPEVINRSAVLAAVDFRTSCGASFFDYEKVEENRLYSLWRGREVSNNVNEYLLAGDPFECPISFFSFSGPMGFRGSIDESESNLSTTYIDTAPYLVIGEASVPTNERSAEEILLGQNPDQLVQSPLYAACSYPNGTGQPVLSSAQKIIYELNSSGELYLLPPGEPDEREVRFTIGCGRIYLDGDLVL